MIVLWIICGLVAAFFLLELGLYLAAFRGRCDRDYALHDFRSHPELRPYRDMILAGQRYIRGTPQEDVTVTAYDGVRLSGRFYDCPQRRGIILMMHGYRSQPSNDFSCSAAHMHGLGFAMLLADQRAHGRSGGVTITFGIRERRDCVTWAEYLARRFPGERIVLEGLSMGASTVVMAAGETLPPEVCGVIADCGYTSPKDIISSVIKSMGLPAKLLYPLVRLAGKLYGRFDCEECSGPEAAARTSLPVLFIHGETDDFVPCRMGLENFDAWAGPKRIVTVPGAGHGLSYVVDMDRCQAELAGFFKEIGI